MYNIFVKKYFKKLKAFTLSEAIVVIVILGVIASITVPQVMTVNYNDKANNTLGKKMVSYLDNAMVGILDKYATIDDFTRLKDSQGYFSVEDSGAEERFAKLVKEFLLDINFEMDKSKEYFNNKIMLYNKELTDEVLKDAYPVMFYANDGVILGFRFYGSCSAVEKYATPPEYQRSYEVTDSCGSVFMDVNAYKRPNKLGSDQFIVPIYKRGLKYDNI